MAKMSGLVVGKPDPEFTNKETGEVKRYPALLLRNVDERFGAHRVAVEDADFSLVEVGDEVSFDVSLVASSYDGEAKLKIKAFGAVTVTKSGGAK